MAPQSKPKVEFTARAVGHRGNILATIKAPSVEAAIDRADRSGVSTYEWVIRSNYLSDGTYVPDGRGRLEAWKAPDTGGRWLREHHSGPVGGKKRHAEKMTHPLALAYAERGKAKALIDRVQSYTGKPPRGSRFRVLKVEHGYRPVYEWKSGTESHYPYRNAALDLAADLRRELRK
jgi:hypothetical protein